MSSTLTGANVPAPTCSVTNARETPAWSSVSSIAIEGRPSVYDSAGSRA
jgi:hypothetical protein